MSILQLGGEELYRDDRKPAKAPTAVSLATDLNRFREIEIFGCTNEWIRCSVRLFKPSFSGTSNKWNSAHFCMTGFNAENGKVYTRWTLYDISQSGTSIKFTPSHYHETCFDGTTVSTYGDSGIQIVRISGWY